MAYTPELSMESCQILRRIAWSLKLSLKIYPCSLTARKYALDARIIPSAKNVYSANRNTKPVIRRFYRYPDRTLEKILLQRSHRN